MKKKTDWTGLICSTIYTVELVHHDALSWVTNNQHQISYKNDQTIIKPMRQLCCCCCCTLVEQFLEFIRKFYIKFYVSIYAVAKHRFVYIIQFIYILCISVYIQIYIHTYTHSCWLTYTRARAHSTPRVNSQQQIEWIRCLCRTRALFVVSK